MQRVALLNGSNINYDYDLSKYIDSIAEPGVIEGLQVTNNNVSSGSAFVKVTRGTKNFFVLFENTETYNFGNRNTYVYIEIDENKIMDGSNNALDGTGIGTVKTSSTLPTKNYLLLRQGGDKRQFIKLKEVTTEVTNIKNGKYDKITLSGQNTMTGSVEGGLTSYDDIDGKVFCGYVTGATNTGSCTINLNSKGAKTVYKRGNVALSEGDIVQYQEILFVYNKTQDRFELLSMEGSQNVVETNNVIITGVVKEAVTKGNLLSLVYGYKNTKASDVSVSSSTSVTTVDLFTFTSSTTSVVGGNTEYLFGVSIEPRLSSGSSGTYTLEVVKNSDSSVIYTSSSTTIKASTTGNGISHNFFNVNKALTAGASYTVRMVFPSATSQGLYVKNIYYWQKAIGTNFKKAKSNGTYLKTPIGFAVDSYSNGATAKIQTSGLVTGLSSRTAGTNYFAYTTAGSLTATDNGYKVGRALSTTTLLIEKGGTPRSETITIGGSGTATRYIPHSLGVKPQLIFNSKGAMSNVDGGTNPSGSGSVTITITEVDEYKVTFTTSANSGEYHGTTTFTLIAFNY